MLNALINIVAASATSLALLTASNAPLLQDERPQATTQSDAPPAAQPDNQATSQPAPVDDNPVNALLDRIEQADKQLATIVADIKTTKKEKILRRTEIRLGQVIYDARPSDRPDSNGSANNAARRFAILFNMRYAGTGIRLRQDERDDHYIFDGRWLADVNYTDKQFIKYEVAAPGELRDPLKLGEGPIPLPLGQPKADILQRFDVTVAEFPGEGPLAKLDRERIKGLHLVPKPHTPIAEDYTSIDLFYDLTVNLPVGIIATATNGDVEYVELSNVKRNEPLTDDNRAKLNITTPPSPPWRIDIRPWGS